MVRYKSSKAASKSTSVKRTPETLEEVSLMLKTYRRLSFRLLDLWDAPLITLHLYRSGQRRTVGLKIAQLHMLARKN